MRRRPRWQVQAEVLVETWLPVRARVVGGAVAVLGMGLGFVVVAGVGVLRAQEPSGARTLVVRSTPPGASLAIDDVRVPGTTPLVVDTTLDDGSHVLKLSLAAGPPAVRRVELTGPDRAVAVSENLQSSGTVRVETRPAGAQVTLDKRHVGVSPVSVADVPLDKPHVVEVEAKGYKKATAPVPVDRGGEHVVRLQLEPQGSPPRLVVVTGIPAELEIDGQPHGLTGLAEHPAIAGPHVVVVRVPALGLERRTTVDVPTAGVLKLFVPVE